MAYSPERGNREDFPRLEEGSGSSWKDWILIMSPTERQGFSERIGHSGYRRESLDTGLHTGCGIYELAIKINAKGNYRRNVVYIGSTCRSKVGNTPARIKEYCRDGSHKADFINEALLEGPNGYKIYARTYPSNNRQAAENAENERLRLYDYAWNERRNGETRSIYP